MTDGASGPGVDVSTELKRVVREFVDSVNAQDWAALPRLVSADFVRHSAAAGSAEISSRNDLIRFLQDEYRTFPDAHEDIIEMMVDGEKVAVWHQFRGTQQGALGP
jgi:predicted ester cyclase